MTLQSYLGKIKREDKKINAFIQLNPNPVSFGKENYLERLLL